MLTFHPMRGIVKVSKVCIHLIYTLAYLDCPWIATSHSKQVFIGCLVSLLSLDPLFVIAFGDVTQETRWSIYITVKSMVFALPDVLKYISSAECSNPSYLQHSLLLTSKHCKMLSSTHR